MVPEVSPQFDEPHTARRTHPLWVIAFWLFVSVPLGWGVWETLVKAVQMFR